MTVNSTESRTTTTVGRRANAGPLPAVVRQLRLESSTVVSLELEAASDVPLPPWTPGSHMDLQLPNGQTRQYSLCGSLSPGSCYRVAVLREGASTGGSEYVHTFLRPGQVVGIGGVRNHFELEAYPFYTFIAGGIGITPIVPMMAQLGDTAPWHLFYTGHRLASMALVDELTERHPGRMTLVPADARERLDLNAALKGTPPDSAVYACGPRSLLDDLTELSTRHPHVTLHTERFLATPRGELRNLSHTLRCERSGRTIQVPAEKSFLAALREANIAIESSCATGLCGTCEVRVTGGTPEHRDDILSGTDRERTDLIYVCVSRAVTEELVLDI